MAENTTTETTTYWDYSDVKSIIFDLLVGAADDNFRTLSCIKCSHFSGADASECDSCIKYTCQDCKQEQDDQTKCSECQAQFKASDKKHPLVKNIIDKAMFKCPYKCSQEQIPLSELVSHIQESCEIALSDCANKCGEKVHVTKVAEHNDQECKNVAVECDVCKKSDVLRHELEAHKGSEECKKPEELVVEVVEVKAVDKVDEEIKEVVEDENNSNCCPLCKYDLSSKPMIVELTQKTGGNDKEKCAGMYTE